MSPMLDFLFSQLASPYRRTENVSILVVSIYGDDFHDL